MEPRQLSKDLMAPAGAALDRVLKVQGDLEHLQDLQSRGSLVFVPTHSSNLDSIVLAQALNGLLLLDDGARERWNATRDGALVGEALNRLDRETLAFHQRVRKGYLALIEAEPERWRYVDAAGAHLATGQLGDEVGSHVRRQRRQAQLQQARQAKDPQRARRAVGVLSGIEGELAQVGQVPGVAQVDERVVGDVAARPDLPDQIVSLDQLPRGPGQDHQNIHRLRLDARRAFADHQ